MDLFHIEIKDKSENDFCFEYYLKLHSKKGSRLVIETVSVDEDFEKEIKKIKASSRNFFENMQEEEFAYFLEYVKLNCFSCYFDSFSLKDKFIRCIEKNPNFTLHYNEIKEKLIHLLEVKEEEEKEKLFFREKNSLIELIKKYNTVVTFFIKQKNGI